MKTSALLIIAFIFITGSAYGQIDIQNSRDNKIGKNFCPDTDRDSPLLMNPDLNSTNKSNVPAIIDLDRFKFFQDSTLLKEKNSRLYSEYDGFEKFPGASRYFAQRPYLIASPSASSFINKPDTATKHHLIIIDPDL